MRESDRKRESESDSGGAVCLPGSLELRCVHVLHSLTSTFPSLSSFFPLRPDRCNHAHCSRKWLDGTNPLANGRNCAFWEVVGIGAGVVVGVFEVCRLETF